MTVKKKKKGFMDGYKTYNPEVEGYGSPDQWREVFYDRFGFEKAVEILGEDDPLSIFGLSYSATWEEVLAKYRKLALQWHPDKNRDKPEESKIRMQKINAAFEVLEKRYNK